MTKGGDLVGNLGRAGGTARLRVLLSAFSCEPGKGSEPEVGFRTLLAAATRHEVWVLTWDVGVEALRAGIKKRPLAERIHLEPIPLGIPYGRLGLLSFHWWYDLWQRTAARRAVELDRRIDFDLAHHVTHATTWTRVGVAGLGKPLVWGPVGGGVEPPRQLLGELGVKGTVENAARVVGRRALATLPHTRAAARSTSVGLAQNRVTAGRMGLATPPVVLTNATAVDLNHFRPPARRDGDIVFVGRLLAWKGTRLLLRALRELRHDDAVLHLYGEGPDRARMERTARQWGVAHRLRFHGWLPRGALLAHLATAGVMVYPSLHDEAGMCVAEALSLGTPVVCLDHGGPAEVVRRWPTSPSRLVAPTSPTVTARRLARAVDGFLDDPPPVRRAPVPPDVSYGDSVLEAYERAVADTARR